LKTQLFLKVILGFAVSATTTVLGQTSAKVLIVVAHPDDEYYFAATSYRIAKELQGTVDELIITNGEGGFHYSTFAEAYYDKPLTVEASGRKELPAIRREEALRAGKIIGIRDHYFLDQKDQQFTTNMDEGLTRLWDTNFITSEISELIRGQQYQFVFTVLPRSTTHGHHQAATILAARAIRSLPESIRPVLLAFDTDAHDFSALPGRPETQGWPRSFSFAFDRDQPLGFHDALSYQIVVSWMIAEHKSQGLLQTMCNKEAKEFAWVDWMSCPGADAKAEKLFHEITPSRNHLAWQTTGHADEASDPRQ
jgi:LmbE family N-acetylglucosaminyl deacetylase